MKTLLLAGATLALLTAVNFAPAMAQGPKPSDDNAWPGISHRRCKCCRGNRALRVPVRIRQARGTAEALGLGPLADSLSKRLQ